MTVKEKLIEYAKENHIYITRLADKIGTSTENFSKARKDLIMAIDTLFRCYEYVGDTKEFKREIGIRIRSQLKLTKHLDIKNISDDDCLKIFNILKKYYKG